MASREYEALVRALKQPLVPPGASLERARARLEGVHGHPVADDTRVEWTELGGVRCAWVEPRSSAASGRVLLLCHGGAFVAAGGHGYLFYAEMLAAPFDARVLLVDYRLAPEQRFPAALEDCANAYRGLLAQGVRPGDVGFVGDSCGGGLAVGALLALRDAGEALPAAAVALGGWFDLEASGESATAPVGFDPFAHAEFVRARGRDYVGPKGDLRDPRVSPIHAHLEGLPPLLLQVGQIDLTRSDALRLAEVAGRSGVEVTLEIVPEMIHGFQGLASAGIPEARAALERAGVWLRARVGGVDS
jgi:acetyl esterase/lipase